MVNSDVFQAMFSHRNTKEFQDSRSENKLLGLDKDYDHPMVRKFCKNLQKSNALNAKLAKEDAHRDITKFWKKNISSRALIMFQTGEGADCVIEVVHQQDGLASKQQEKKVFSFAFRLCNLENLFQI
jgi:hypothetical protein